MSASKSPFSLMVDPTRALAAAQRLSQTLPSRISSLDERKGKTLSDELARFDEDVDSGR